VPRQSAESRAAAAYRAGSAPPRPPQHLSKEAALIWREIAASKPTDWFDAGACILLEQFCQAAVQARGIAKRLDRLRKAGAWEEAKPWEKRLPGGMGVFRQSRTEPGKHVVHRHAAPRIWVGWGQQ
jgi:phage terminase small subunit